METGNDKITSLTLKHLWTLIFSHTQNVGSFASSLSITKMYKWSVYKYILKDISHLGD